MPGRREAFSRRQLLRRRRPFGAAASRLFDPIVRGAARAVAAILILVIGNRSTAESSSSQWRAVGRLGLLLLFLPAAGCARPAAPAGTLPPSVTVTGTTQAPVGHDDARPGAGSPSGDVARLRAGAARLRAGAASRVITPDLSSTSKPVYMAGMDRELPATSVHDDLHARALVITDGNGTSVGLVVLDLIGFFHDDVEAVRAELLERHPDVQLNYLAVASTHTHAGPDVMGLWTPIGGSTDAAYIARVRDEAVEAVAEAWRRRRPARLFVARGDAPDLAKDTRLPHVIDETVMAMGLQEVADGAGIATLVNWGSHPSVMGGGNTLISADFPAALTARMEQEWGGIALYASGALGGQIGSGRVKLRDPDTGSVPDSRVRLTELIGREVAKIALDSLHGVEAAGAADDPLFTIRKKTIFVPLDNERFTRGLSIGLIRERRLFPRPDGGALSEEFERPGAGQLPTQLTDRSMLRPGAFSLRSEVALIDLGPVRWILVPGEPYPELTVGGIQQPQEAGADFQGAALEPALRQMSDRPIFVIGLANDELGYVIPKSEWDSEPPYAYGRDESQYGERNSCGPETAPVLMEALKSLM